MRVFLIFSAVFYTVCYTTGSPISGLDPLSDEFINHINNQQSTWKAGRNYNKNYPMESIKRLMGTRNDRAAYKLPVIQHEIPSLPDEFDARKQWPNCTTIGEIGDQANCASGWAFGAVEAMSDRVCIHSNGEKVVRISAQNIISCSADSHNPFIGGCNSGIPYKAWKHWEDDGIVTGGSYGTNDTCQPYKKAPCEHHMEGLRPDCSTEDPSTPKCDPWCINEEDYENDRTFGKEPYTVMSDEESIRTEIMKNGPVQATFTVFEDFLQYKSGVYYHVSGDELGFHFVKLFGWGIENNTPFWWASNSFNTDWGDKGFFKILRGKDECGIEFDIAAGLPKL